MDDESLLSGNGSPADFLNSTGADAVYADNQSVADALDNGPITSTATSTTVASPTWQQNLASIFTTAGAAVNTVKPLLGSTTGGTPAPAAAAANATAAASKASNTLWIILGLVGVVLAFLFFKKH
jgi:hypothetical protein